MKFDVSSLVSFFLLVHCADVALGQGNKPAKAGKIKRNNNNNGKRKGIDFGELVETLDVYDQLEIEFEIEPNGPKKTKFKKENVKKDGAPPGLAKFGIAESWYGRSETGEAVAQMTKLNGVTIGSITNEKANRLTRIVTDAVGNSYTEDIDLTTLTDDEDGEEVDVWDGGRLPRLSDDSRRRLESTFTAPLRGQRREATTTFDDSGATIDLMVVWTSWAECAMSYLPRGCQHTEQTTANMRARIAAGIEETNVAFYLSGIDLIIRLVHAYRTPNYVEYEDPARSSACSTALRDIKTKNDGYMDEAHDLRSIHGADMVSLLVGDLGCNGVAYRATPVASKDDVFSVVKYERITGTYTFPHELGHNMGCNHDKGTKDVCDSSAINYGYRDPQARFRSILSYDCTSENKCETSDVVNTCIRVQRFSNTYSLYPYGGGAGVPIGTDEINNAEHIKTYKHAIAGYFPTAVCSSDLDCDDDNACTSDFCNTNGFCAHTDMPGCCGNGICEADEDPPSCEADCAYEFETTFTGSSTRNANMFDIKARNDVDIYGMEIHVDTNADFDVEVWTRSGSWVGHMGSSNGWTQILSTTVTGQGARFGTPLPNFSSSIPMFAGETRAFYIYSTSKVLESSYGLDESEGTIVEFNDDMELKQGRDQNSYFGTSYYSDKVWNGVIKYTTDNSSPPTPATPPPAPAPTPSGTPALKYIINGGSDYGLCEGECDDDSDCKGDLLCYQRSQAGTGPGVPGCTGEYLEDLEADFCYQRQSPNDYHVKPNGLGTGQYGLCEGDCDNDLDCIGDLICYKRYAIDGGGSVLGCNGEYEFDLDEDFCGLPEVAAPTPTAAPTSMPSYEPSATPSFRPSAMHSSEPSSSPSLMSSSMPSSEPISTPSFRPSTMPSSEPSATPSFRPSTMHSSEPSSSPSLMSSSMPSSEPISTPSFRPSTMHSSEPSSSPSSSPATTPAPKNTTPDLAYIGNDFGAGQYGLCEGDCDDDSDCQGDLLCYERSPSGTGPTVPGCAGKFENNPETDFCYQPINPYAELTDIGNNYGQGAYGLCEGDCDDDSDCQGDLLCYQRSSSGAGPSVPGCAGKFLSDLSTDFCYQRQGPREYHVKKNNLGEGQYGLCEGDCDENSDCIGDLICHIRSSNSEGVQPVPGCNGEYGFDPGMDFCGEP